MRAAVADELAQLIDDVRRHQGAPAERSASILDLSAADEDEIRAAQLGDDHDVVLLEGLLRHGDSIGAALCEVAAKALATDGIVVVRDARVDRAGRYIRSWLAAAGLVDIEERRLEESPEDLVVVGRKPVEDDVARRLDSDLSRVGKIAWRELEADGRLRADAQPRRLEYPSPLRRMLSRALAASDDHGKAKLERHYLEEMPRMRVAQIVGTDEPGATLMHLPLDWSQLPRMCVALDRLFALVADAAVDPALALNAENATAFRAGTPTLGELTMRTHHGGWMPLRHALSSDLAYFMSRGLDEHATIDRYLTGPVIHALCYFGRHREALPLHLDACVASYLGVRVWPESAYPAPGEDDGIFGVPWLAQVGQAIARAFGITPVVRGHTFMATWATMVPRGFVTAAERIAWDDWLARRSLDFLSDAFAPGPWVALALVAGAGLSLRDHTLGSLAQVPLGSLVLRDDAAFDRVIVEDGLRATCTHVPPAPIEIDARACSVTTSHTGNTYRPAPEYWLPPAVGAKLMAHGIAKYELRLSDVRAIPEAAAAICDATRASERDGFSLVTSVCPGVR